MVSQKKLVEFLQDERSREIIRFLVVGGGCFVFEYALLYSLTEYGHISYLISAAVAFTLSLIINYILCSVFVFRAGNRGRKEIFLFAVTSLAGLGINQVTMWFFVEIIGLWYMFAKVIASGLVMVWNYLTKRYILHGHM